MRTKKSRLLVGLVALLLPVSCGSLLSTSTFFTNGDSFIDQGTFQMQSGFLSAPCPVWVDTSGITYHLFQGPNISNADFDAITTPNTTSRLKIHTRSDLKIGCGSGPAVEVDAVIEVIG